MTERGLQDGGRNGTGVRTREARGMGRTDAANGGPAAPLAVRPEEAFRLISVSRAHGYRLIQSGEIASFKSGRARLVPLDALRAWIARKAG